MDCIHKILYLTALNQVCMCLNWSPLFISRSCPQIASFSVNPNYEVIFFSSKPHEAIDILSFFNDNKRSLADLLTQLKNYQIKSESSSLYYSHLLWPCLTMCFYTQGVTRLEQISTPSLRLSQKKWPLLSNEKQTLKNISMLSLFLQMVASFNFIHCFYFFP